MTLLGGTFKSGSSGNEGAVGFASRAGVLLVTVQYRCSPYRQTIDKMRMIIVDKAVNNEVDNEDNQDDEDDEDEDNEDDNDEFFFFSLYSTGALLIQTRPF